MKNPDSDSLRYRERALMEVNGHAEPAFPASDAKFLARNFCRIQFVFRVVVEENRFGNPGLLNVCDDLALEFLVCHDENPPVKFENLACNLRNQRRDVDACTCRQKWLVNGQQP